jgi:hypothetical protein
MMADLGVSQELGVIANSVNVASQAATRGDWAVLHSALIEVQERTGRVLKTIEPEALKHAIDPLLPTEPRSPIREGEA